MAASEKHTKSPILWVVDDSAADHELLRIAFKPHLDLARMRTFSSAEAAVEALKRGDEPSLVLLDLNMPGRGGLYLLKERRERQMSHVPVVILSSSSNPDDIKEAYALGANSYLVKPSDLSELMEFAESFCAYWFKFSHLPREVF